MLDITWGFFALMGVLFVIDVVTRFVGRHRDFRSVIVSLGVLGTFVGIYWGLQDFETTDLRSSVPLLLAGMKTAFITSIVGMGLSLVLSIFGRLLTSEEGSVDEALIGVQTRLNRLLDTQERIEQAQAQQAQALQNRLDEALNKLSVDASAQIVAALESAIREFNTGVSEQLGGNFAQLNDAVGRLVVWQQQYRVQLDADRELLAQSESLLRACQNQNTLLQEGQQQLQASLAAAAPVMAGLHAQTESLQTQLQRYGQAGESALQSLQRLESTVTEVSAGMEQHSQSLSRMTSEVTRQLPGALEALEDTLLGLTQRFADDYQAFLNHYRQLTREG